MDFKGGLLGTNLCMEGIAR